MTRQPSLDAIRQRAESLDAPVGALPDASAAEDVSWLDENRERLECELERLYERSDAEERPVRQRIAQILRAFHAMGSGEYGVCACCGLTVSKSHLQADPARDICETCG